jgi:DNA polymerase I-like protein with 3'-5' exonuclease and polymerase domains
MTQLPLFTPDSEWKPPSLSDLPDWTGAGRVAVDVETNDPWIGKKMGPATYAGGYICGYSFAIEDHPDGGFYLPIRHEGGDNVDPVQALNYLRHQARHFTGTLVGANIGYDLGYLGVEDIRFPQVEVIRDVLIADPLINELHNSYSLDSVLERNGLPGKEETLLDEAARSYGVDKKGGMWKLPGRYVGPYGEGDAIKPLALLRRQERIIDEQGLWDIFNLESAVTPVLVKMRERGVRVDLDRLRQIEEWTLSQERDLLAAVKQETGVNIAVGDVWKADVLAPVFEQLGVDLARTKTGKVSINQELFASIQNKSVKCLARARKINKLRTTFAASIRRHQINGRIHCNYNQIVGRSDEAKEGVKGVRYGRLSVSNPNLQQQPAREDFSAMWRSIYVPEEGCQWASNDYSQQEPRWTTHFAAVMDLEGAKAAAQAYWDDPTIDNHQFMADLTGLPRKAAKTVYLGLCYGEGGAAMCDDLGLPTRWAISYTPTHGRRRREYFDTRGEAQQKAGDLPVETFIWRAAGEEGQHILDTFDNRAPFIRQLSRKAEDRAKTRGYVTTIAGRHLHFPQSPNGSYDFTHKGLNRVIQGSSGDQTKRAMVEIDREMPDLWMNLQVHDELANSVEHPKQAESAARIMRDCIPAKVPFRVDIELGNSWGESMGYEWKDNDND